MVWSPPVVPWKFTWVVTVVVVAVGLAGVTVSERVNDG
jgi:hypothetical protein